ncbi:MAG TPA: hypothetical protein VG271_03970, partial [Beijerinckiaceae bacterium]|nr:hypothetical protein [Beijerinckiaceae bacterium]
MPGSDNARLALAALAEIVEVLPIGVTVRGDDARIIFTNRAALDKDTDAAGFNSTSISTASNGESREHEGSVDEAISASVSAFEEHIVGSSGERTYLTIEKRVCLRGEELLLSSSLDITDRKQIEERLLERAFFDELTRLPNRSMVEEHVKKVLDNPDCRFA